LLHVANAFMYAVPPAARRKIRISAGSDGQQRRDQRKAEEYKQDEAEKASHGVIIVGEFWGA
jgi:ribosomal protein L12E/L44/L45/RPP1/RPP2